MSIRVQFADYEFDPSSGLLTGERDGEPTSVRLPPQPAKLLMLLLERAPDLVSREEIQAQLWPDVQVDFDRSLHFCVRQVRAALKEEGANPRFIETIPRRGYRWMTDVKFVESATAGGLNSPSAEHETKPTTGKASADHLPNTENKPPDDFADGTHPPVELRNRRRMLAAAMFFIAAAVCGLAYIVSVGGADDRKPSVLAPTKWRIGVMPFESAEFTAPQTENNAYANNGIAEQLVNDLTNDAENRFDVIGPTTTVAYRDEAEPLRRLGEEYDIDFILNGRFLLRNNRVRLLGEVIRASDGAHVWTRMFDEGVTHDEIAIQMREGLDTVVDGDSQSPDDE